MIEWDITPVMAGALAGVVFFGMAIGAYFGGILSDRYGRKGVFTGSIFDVAFFGVASAFSNGYWSFLILRALMGVGLGAALPCDHAIMM
jgi:MFS family permease